MKYNQYREEIKNTYEIIKEIGNSCIHGDKGKPRCGCWL